VNAGEVAQKIIVENGQAIIPGELDVHFNDTRSETVGLADRFNGVLDRQSGVISGIRPHTVMSYRDWPYVEPQKVFRGTAGLRLRIFGFICGRRYECGVHRWNFVGRNAQSIHPDSYGINDIQYPGYFVGRGALFFMEGFLGVRYGATAREFVLHQKFASIAMLVALVAIFLAIRWFPLHRRNQQSPIV
jgi:hypothetical protein